MVGHGLHYLGLWNMYVFVNWRVEAVFVFGLLLIAALLLGSFIHGAKNKTQN